ncbi:MAG: nitroreductase family protein [Planctomycetota bacterium]
METPEIPQALDVPAAIAARRSTKDFRPDRINPALLQRILDLTTEAPSSWNLQPWRIVVIDDNDSRESLHKACFEQRQVLEAPVTLVFAVDIDAWEGDMAPIIEQARTLGAWPDPYCKNASEAIPVGQNALSSLGRLREYAIKDAMIAATHCVLAATSFGLQTTYMNGWREDAVKEVIGATNRDEIAIAVLVAIGHAKKILAHPGRVSSKQTVFRGRLPEAGC